MSTPKRKESPLSIHHVMYRGINKQQIFADDDDYGKFLTVLRKYEPICGFKLLAYCLMSNHIHLVIKTGEMPLGRIFQHVIPSFVYWYNKKYERVGSLFQARFKSRPICNNNQLLTVIKYVHQNPVKAAICKHPGHYQYSSFKGYFRNDLIDASYIRSFISPDGFNRFNCDKTDKKRKKGNPAQAQAQAEKEDFCIDIEDEKPRLNDKRAMEIMIRLSGCGNASEFQALDTALRDKALLDMRIAGVSVSQANRITGISCGMIRKAGGSSASSASRSAKKEKPQRASHK